MDLMVHARASMHVPFALRAAEVQDSCNMAHAAIHICHSTITGTISAVQSVVHATGVHDDDGAAKHHQLR